MNRAVKIKIVNLEQYLLKGSYKYSHQRIAIPVDLGHEIYSLTATNLKLFLYLIGRTAADKSHNPLLHSLQISNAVSIRHNVVCNRLRVLQENHRLIIYDLIDLIDLKERKIDLTDLKTVQTKKKEMHSIISAIAQSQRQENGQLKVSLEKGEEKTVEQERKELDEVPFLTEEERASLLRDFVRKKMKRV